MDGKLFKNKVLPLLLLTCLLMQSLFFPLGVQAAEPSGSGHMPNIETKISSQTETGSTNYFKYSSGGWVKAPGQEEAYYDVSNGEANASDHYYEVHFTGNGISLYGMKAPVHGKIKISIDGGPEQTVDTHAETRSQVMCIFTKEGLEEGEHSMKVCATGENVSGQSMAVIQVNYAMVKSVPGMAESFSLAQSRFVMDAGSSQTAEITYSPQNTALADLLFTSDSPEVVSVNQEGQMQALREGTAKITVTSAAINQKAAFQVTVTPAHPDLCGGITDSSLHYTQDKYAQVAEGGMNRFYSLYGWKADKINSEIILASKNAVSGLQVSAQDFVSEEHVIPAECIQTTFLKETDAYKGRAWGTLPEGERLQIPDIVYSNAPIDLDAGRIQPIWVEINIPGDAAPGIYEGSITVQAEGMLELPFFYELEVFDLTMPAPEDYDFDVEYWQYPYSIAEYYDVEPFSEEHLEILKTHMLEYKELGGHAITASIVEEAWNGQTYSKNNVHYPSMIKWTKKVDGTFSFNYDHFDKWVSLNKSIGLGDKIVCYSLIPWENWISYYDEATSATKKIQVTPGTAEYTAAWKPFLESLITHVEEKGWFDDIYIGIDERSNMDKAFDLVEETKNQEGKSFKISAAMNFFGASWKNVTDRSDSISVNAGHAKGDLNTFKNFVKDRKESSQKDYKTTLYTCTGDFPNSLAHSMPCESYWTILLSAAQNCTGYMRWAFDAWVEDPLRDSSHTLFEAGDCFLIYPDEKGTEHPESKESVRLKKLDEGTRDANKLYQMREEYPALDTACTELLATVKTNYTADMISGASHANAVTKAQLPGDMRSIKNGIREISGLNTALNQLNSSMGQLKELPLENAPQEIRETVTNALAQGQAILESSELTLDEVNEQIEALRQTRENVCTCKIEGLSFPGQDVVIPYQEQEKRIPLLAAAVKGGNCILPEHQENITFHYAITEDLARIGRLEQNSLIVSGPGELKVTVTAQISGTEAKEEASARYRVTKQGNPVPPIKVELPSKPGAIKKVTASGNKEHKITLSWRKSANATGYVVERRTSGKGTWKPVKTTASARFTDVKLNSGTIYQYRVQPYASNSAGTTKGSYSKSLTTATGTSAPKLKVKSLADGSARLSWKKVNRADGYMLEIKKGKKAFRRLKTVGKKTLSYKITGMDKKTAYRFRMKAYKKAGGKRISSAYSKVR